MTNSGVRDPLSSVIAAIAEKPYSPATRNLVERTLEEELAATAQFRGFTIPEFIRMMRLSIVATGFTRAGIKDVQVLNKLAEAVPEGLDIDIIFREIDENGRRSLWQYTTAARDARELCEVWGRSHEFTVWHNFGMYAMFMAGIFPDILKTRKKWTVNVAYYESTGSQAFLQAAVATPDLESAVLTDIARNFRGYRRVLNLAGSLVGTPAKQTAFRDIVASYEHRAQANEKRQRQGIDNVLLLPAVQTTGSETKPNYNCI